MGAASLLNFCFWVSSAILSSCVLFVFGLFHNVLFVLVVGLASLQMCVVNYEVHVLCRKHRFVTCLKLLGGICIAKSISRAWCRR